MFKSTRLAAVLCCLVTQLSAQSGLQMFDESFVHEIRVYLDEPDFWEILSTNYGYDLDDDENTMNIPLMAKVKLDGNEVDSVAINQKGFFSNWGSGESLKKPLKLDFNEFVADGKYDGLKSLNLQNAFMDPSLMRDMLSYRILRDFGVAAPRSSYAKVYLNDVYWGLYVLVESVNKTFLKEHFGDNDGNLYKAEFTSMQYFGPNQSDYYINYELKTNETVNDWSRLIRLLDVINNTPDNTFRDSLNAHLDMVSYLKSLAVDVTIVNWDSHFDHGRNFYLYDNPSDGKFYWIPWDYNLAFAGGFANYDITLEALRNSPEYDKILPKRVLENEAFKADYLQFACSLHQNVFTPAHLNPIIEQTEALIEDELEDDPNKFYPDIEDFHTALTIGFENLVIDSFHLVDSSWNGTMWVVIDTVFIFEYLDISPGLKSMILDRRTSIQAELDVFGVECISPVKEPGIAITTPSLKIWPNPSSDWLNIQLPESESIISIFDVQGRLVNRGQFSSTEIAIPVQDYAPGFYWVECVTKNVRSREKLVITR